MPEGSREDATGLHAGAGVAGRPVAARHAALHGWWHHVFGHLPAIVWLTLLTAALHPLHLFERLDGVMMRWVVQGYLEQETSEVALAAAHQRIGVLEVSGAMRLGLLEQTGGSAFDPDTVKRLEGIRPVNRGAMADLLERLALRLGQLPPEARVLAIDVDLAPLDDSQDELELRQRVIDALAHLRRHAQVVVIAMDRVTPPMRHARDEFMQRAQCTRLARASVPTTSSSTPPHGLYFASSWLFQRAGGYPMRFPTDLLRGQPSVELPPKFPTLGTLVHLLRKPVGAFDSSDDPDRMTLTALCEHAWSSGAAGSAILGDRIEAVPNATRDLIAHYDTAWFNWTLQNSHLFGPHQITSLNAIAPASNNEALPRAGEMALDDDDLGTPLLVLSIRGAGTNDRFGGASTGVRSFSGAWLHSLQAASLAQPLVAANVSGALTDFGIGLLFVCLWAGVAPWLQRLEMVAPRIGSFAAAMIPLTIAALLVGLSGWLATRLMYHWDIWFNPVLVIVGLALHTYLQRRDEPSVHADWSFGVRDSLAAWRARASEPSAVPGPPAVPVAHARAWLLWDLLLTTAVRLGFIVAGVAMLAMHAHRPAELGFLTAIVAVLAGAAFRSAPATGLKGPT